LDAHRRCPRFRRRRPAPPLEWSKHVVFTPSLKQLYRRPDVWRSSRAGGMHPLAAYAVEIFGAAKPSKGVGILVTHRTQAIDMTVTHRSLDWAVTAANALFTAIETKGHDVVIETRRPFTRPALDGRANPSAPANGIPKWYPRWPTIATISGVPLGLAIFEVLERVEVQYAGHGAYVAASAVRKGKSEPITGITWREEQWAPTGRLRLVAYSPNYSVPWQASWELSNRANGQAETESIVSELEEAAKAFGSTGF